LQIKQLIAQSNATSRIMGMGMGMGMGIFRAEAESTSLEKALNQRS
jgi:hypothetical protein